MTDMGLFLWLYKAGHALINEDFCSLARRERFLRRDIYSYISSLKKREQRRQGAKRPLITIP
jgi:hypothetical protein